MYSKDKIEIALKLYHQCGTVGEVVQTLGYPTRQQLYTWIKNEGIPPKDRKKLPKTNNPPEHPRNPPYKIKLDAIKRCYEQGYSIKSVSQEIGYSRSSIYQWRLIYLKEGTVGLMNNRNIQPGELVEGIRSTEDTIISSKEVTELKAQLQDMQLEIDILKETIDVLKKDPGIDKTALRNREKAVIINALKSKYSLSVLLRKLRISKSSYYYQESAFKREDKYLFLKETIKILFAENKKRYGYRRIYGLLKNAGITVSEKIVRRIMKDEGFVVKVKKFRKYSSYKGEITPAVPNEIGRNFHADKPHQKWLTDITEFAIPAGKVYLSPIVDCFDGMLHCWRIGTSPDSILVNSMLDEAISLLGENEHPIVHSDRGCHYRWPGWIERMNKAGLTRSMSKKGCSPDNSACEGLFGRLKNEMFYNNDWTGISIDEFIAILNEYLVWYNEERIKESLGYMSPTEYRHSLGLAGVVCLVGSVYTKFLTLSVLMMEEMGFILIKCTN